MAAVLRNVTRTIFDNGTAAETTRFTQSPSSDPLAFPLASTGKFLIGFKRPFSTRHFNLKTPNAAPVNVTLKYFDGTAFVAVEDLIDSTIGFTQSGFISWINKSNWQKSIISPIDDKELFWAELTVDVTLDAGVELESVLNLFCDEELLRRDYPELVSDSRFLPPGRNDFIEQLIGGTDEVVKRLKRDGVIVDVADVIDINEVSDAAVHFTAYTILRPIAVGEADIAMRNKAFSDGNHELNGVKIDLDVTGDGVIEEHEKNVGNTFIARG